MAKQEGARQESRFVVISTCPDVCKSPTTPAPYQISGFLDKSILVSPNVRSNGVPVFHMGSRVATVIGDEAGVGGGVVSQSIKGFCKPIVPVTSVRVNGQFANDSVITYMLMNGATPEGPFNTIGQLKFLGPMFFADVGPGGTVPPGANSIVAGENGAEMGCLPKLGGIGGAGGGGLGDLVGMAKKAYGLATTDWSNPSAVLGAIGGVAGMAGMGGLAQATQLAQQGYNLATADWSNPGAAMGAIMGAAGPMLGGLGLGGGGGGTGPILTTGGFAGGNPAAGIPAGSNSGGNNAPFITTGGFAGGNPAAGIPAGSNSGVNNAPFVTTGGFAGGNPADNFPPGLTSIDTFGF